MVEKKSVVVVQLALQFAQGGQLAWKQMKKDLNIRG